MTEKTKWRVQKHRSPIGLKTRWAVLEGNETIMLTSNEYHANLMATAPDLLLACELVSENWSYGEKGSQLEKILNSVRDAIAKVKRTYPGEGN